MHPTRVVLLLVRRRVAQPGFTRALQDAVALAFALILNAPQTVIHRQLAADLNAAVAQFFLRDEGRATG
jgi:hypothetical protein